MIGLFAPIAAAAPAPNAVPSVVGGLSGCWDVTGQVRGKDAPSIARGDWHKVATNLSVAKRDHLLARG